MFLYWDEVKILRLHFFFVLEVQKFLKVINLQLYKKGWEFLAGLVWCKLQADFAFLLLEVGLLFLDLLEEHMFHLDSG